LLQASCRFDRRRFDRSDGEIVQSFRDIGQRKDLGDGVRELANDFGRRPWRHDNGEPAL